MAAPRALRVVTLPPGLRGGEVAAFARDVRRRGADLLELRSDLYSGGEVDAGALAKEIGLLAAERGRPLAEGWIRAAALVDREIGSAGAGSASLVSFHSPAPLPAGEAVARWRRDPPPKGAHLKHVEPLGAVPSASRLLETQARLAAELGPDVTVLATGPLALPFRAVLAERNALDYLAAGAGWSSAAGQRLLDDAARAARGAGRSRLGILGTGIAGSRSPRIHPQPFDRLDLPEEAPIAELLAALHAHYRGFAVTSPFKRAAARAVASPLEAVNTLVRTPSGWDAFNTDVAGAREVIARLGEVTALGDGGATAALRLAAREGGRELRVLRRTEIGAPLSGSFVWTWPDRIAPPERLEFREAAVAVIAYGAAGRRVRDEVLRRGGRPVLLGAAWFVAQARAQRARWEKAT